MTMIADYTFKLMRSKKIDRILWGDGILIEIACGVDIKVQKPLAKMAFVLLSLRNDVRFKSIYVNYVDTNGKIHKIRGFILNQTYSNGIEYLNLDIQRFLHW